jgi:hypothetical protein
MASKQPAKEAKSAAQADIGEANKRTSNKGRRTNHSCPNPSLVRSCSIAIASNRVDAVAGGEQLLVGN